MSIQDKLKKLNPHGKRNQSNQGPNTKLLEFFKSQDFFIAAIFVFVALISFGLGRLSVEEPARPPVIPLETPLPPADKAPLHSALQTDEELKVATPVETQAVSAGSYVASKNGTKYHLPWCAGGQQIKEENKIWFSSKEEAEAAGYAPASNCKGI